MMKARHPVLIIGAGPAGLTAAYELVRQGIRPLVLERDDMVGGLARTETYKGYRFDIGGHRFFTKVDEVQRLWQEVLGEEFVKVSRLSRIFYRGRFFNYPLEPFNALSNLGVVESLQILGSYFRAKVAPSPEEETFEQWVTNRFGKRLYQTFFKTYTEKVWGIPCHTIRADWAAQRIKGLSLKTAIVQAFFGSHNTRTLVNEFHHPVLGTGMMWERFQEAVERQGGQVQLDTEAIRLQSEGRDIKSVAARQGERMIEIAGEHFISTMPLTDLIARLDPPAPDDVAKAARQLSYRALIVVGLIVDRADLFPDQWVYVHSPGFRVGRIQNFKNWSAAMVPDPRKTSLGIEYFCSEGDGTWSMSDAELLELASRELAGLGLAEIGEVEEGVVIRQRQAYPVYDGEYSQHLEVVRRFLSTFENLQTIGRNGMHRYNNQDHSMLMGMLAVRNLLGEHHDLWSVNVDRSYYEEFTTDRLRTGIAEHVASR